jgi:hypothetical protein
MTFCCSVFADLVDSAGKAGLSVIAKESGALQGFFLQARAHDVDQEYKLRQMPRAIDPPKPFVMLVQQGIKFCPFCGNSLDEVILSQPEEFFELSRRQASLSM